MNSSKNGGKTVFLNILVALVALVAVGSALFVYINILRDRDENSFEQDLPYRPSPELESEMYEAAQRLINDNVLVAELFITHGLPVIPEPYANSTDKPLGNPPEDGYFYVDGGAWVRDRHYRTYSDIENIVRETFISAEAERILNNALDDNAPYYSDFGRIYAEKRANLDGFELGINESFAFDRHPYPGVQPDFAADWSQTHTSFALTPVSDVECVLKLELKPEDGDARLVERRMTYTDGEARQQHLKLNISLKKPI